MHPDYRARLIRHEFDSRQRGYPFDFPGLEFLLIEHDGRAVGRLYVQRTDPRWIFLVDLVLLPEWQGRGLGTWLLHGLQEEARATNRPLRLHVEKVNPRAHQLYLRFGFRLLSEIRTHYLLEWRA